MEALLNAPALPTRILSLCQAYKAWVVGGAADPHRTDPPKDYDIVVPFNEWPQATQVIPSNATKNTFGGFKFRLEGVDAEIDMWPDYPEHILQRPKCRWAYNPGSNTLLHKLDCRFKGQS